MPPENIYSTWVEIDLSAIEGNARYVQEKTGRPVMAVVKANAYGHGAIPVAQAALRGGAAWLGVARLEEGLQLRQAGIDCPVLLLGLTPPGRVKEAITNRLAMTVWDPSQVERADAEGQRLGLPAHLHLKVDTGMSRLGIQPQEVLPLAQQVTSRRGVVFEGVFTHFARADEPDLPATRSQMERFDTVVAALESGGLRPSYVHASNSAASLAYPGAYYDMVRLGIALYGLQPFVMGLLPSAFRPALSWKAVLSQVKVLPPGRGVSYGHAYITQADERIGTLPVGYADGFRRTSGNMVLAGGQRVPVVGRVCMDQSMLQLDHLPQSGAGDEVVLIGKQGDEEIRTEEVARRWGTISHEVVCGIAARVPRIYL